LIPLPFNRIRIVSLGKFSHCDQSSESGAGFANWARPVARSIFRFSVGQGRGLR
jgi:hypothetical protein